MEGRKERKRKKEEKILVIGLYQEGLLPAMRETRVQSLGQEDPLEDGMASHSSILAWRIPWTGESGRPQSIGSQKNHTQLK